MTPSLSTKHQLSVFHFHLSLPSGKRERFFAKYSTQSSEGTKKYKNTNKTSTNSSSPLFRRNNTQTRLLSIRQQFPCLKNRKIYHVLSKVWFFKVFMLLRFLCRKIQKFNHKSRFKLTKLDFWGVSTSVHMWSHQFYLLFNFRNLFFHCVLLTCHHSSSLALVTCRMSP